MSTELETARSALAKLRNTLVKKLEDQKSDVKETATELKKLDAAIKHLDDGKKPAPSKETILAVVLELLGQNEEMPEEDLRELVKQKLRKDYELVGSMRYFGAWLKADPRIDVAKEGVWRLRRKMVEVA